MAGNSYSPLLGANAWPRWERSRRFIGYIQANGNKITVGSFKNLRAMVTRLAQVGSISAESFQKHATTCYSSSILSIFCFCQSYRVTQDTQRKEICSEIARLLKEERLRQKLSLNALSAKAGLNRQTVSFIEQEERTPTIDTLLRLTDVLGVKLETIIGEARRRAAK